MAERAADRVAFSHRNTPASSDAAQRAQKIGQRLHKAALDVLVELVVTGKRAYSDIAEFVENRSYEEWKRGRFASAVASLQKIGRYLESLENKNEEVTLDLAEVYQLIGQLYQYEERYPESIEWFSRSVLVNDGNSLPYHCMAQSYATIGNIEAAIRCFEQELAIDEGNYFTYLALSELYDRLGKPDRSEECLQKLLSRDPENIQGLHRLIQHYETHDPTIDVGLLRKRLLGIAAKHTWTTAAIRAYHLRAEKRYAEALAFLTEWQLQNGEHVLPVVYLVRTLLHDDLQAECELRREVGKFIKACKSRQEVMRGYIEEFVKLFGDQLANRLKRTLQAA